jgi:hypothetical protein
MTIPRSWCVGCCFVKYGPIEMLGAARTEPESEVQRPRIMLNRPIASMFNMPLKLPTQGSELLDGSIDVLTS